MKRIRTFKAPTESKDYSSSAGLSGERQLLRSNEKQFRGRLVSKARRRVVSLNSTPRVIGKKCEADIYIYIYIYVYIYTWIYIYIYIYKWCEANLLAIRLAIHDVHFEHL